MSTKKETTLADYIVDPPTTTKKRGGPQPGSGRPKKDPKDKVVKCRISMTQAHYAATEGDRAGMIRKALEFYPGDVDTCIAGTVMSVEFRTDNWGVDLKAVIEFVGGASVTLYVQKTFFCAPGDKLKIAFCDGHTNVQKLNPPSGDNQPAP